MFGGSDLIWLGIFAAYTQPDIFAPIKCPLVYTKVPLLTGESFISKINDFLS